MIYNKIPARINPDVVKQHNVDLSILNAYFKRIKESTIETKNNEGVLRVIDSFKFLKVNLIFVAHFAHNQGAVRQVLRDHKNTPMILRNDYRTPAIAQRELETLVKNFETAIIEMTQLNRQKKMAKKISFSAKDLFKETTVAAALAYACSKRHKLDKHVKITPTKAVVLATSMEPLIVEAPKVLMIEEVTTNNQLALEEAKLITAANIDFKPSVVIVEDVMVEKLDVVPQPVAAAHNYNALSFKELKSIIADLAKSKTLDINFLKNGFAKTGFMEKRVLGVLVVDAMLKNAVSADAVMQVVQMLEANRQQLDFLHRRQGVVKFSLFGHSWKINDKREATSATWGMLMKMAKNRLLEIQLTDKKAVAANDPVVAFLNTKRTGCRFFSLPTTSAKILQEKNTTKALTKLKDAQEEVNGWIRKRAVI